ncbi:hypothetical protein ABT299_03285 [Spirillospora sp. NPDC000708]|jgi:hypothetical protein|uniref:hypothetical protein n=1 Tax=Actinomadura sp. RB99 TaxID=2691577 RepID=UPI00168934FD|nr:hypothetical protein [Actinomadura sp. RB99]MBD2897447.1 hypothetical protein [Actinomadura sp. RB99]
MSSDSERRRERAGEPAPDPPGPGSGPAESAPPAPDSLVPPPEPVPFPVDASDVDEAVRDVTAGREPGGEGDISPEQVRERLRRRAIFLRELAEARELRRRVTPHRSRRARIHAALRRRTFRIN